MVGVPYVLPKMDFERKVRTRLVKRHETPTNNQMKIGRKEFQPGYAAYQNRLRLSEQKIPIIGDNYRHMLENMELN
jgi:hypothetical protein